MKFLDTQTQLPIGTEVRVNDKVGTVVDCEQRKDQFGQPIMVHKIHFTGMYKRTIGRGYKVVPMNPFTRFVNYSNIQY